MSTVLYSPGGYFDGKSGALQTGVGGGGGGAGGDGGGGLGGGGGEHAGQVPKATKAQY